MCPLLSSILFDLPCPIHMEGCVLGLDVGMENPWLMGIKKTGARPAKYNSKLQATSRIQVEKCFENNSKLLTYIGLDMLLREDR
jgi:hypothetical protein